MSPPANNVLAELDQGSDAALLVDAMVLHHPDPFRYLPPHALLEAARQTRADSRPPLVSLMQLGASLGPRNGHTGIFPNDRHRTPLQHYPLKLHEFEDGVFVTQAAEDALVGAELEAIGAFSIEAVLAEVAPLIPRDNEWTIRARRPSFVTTAEVLYGLGIADELASMRLRLRTGERRTVAISPTSVRPLAPQAKPWSIERLPDARVVHVTYTRMRSDTTPLAGQLRKVARRADTAVVALDLRANGGGDNRTYGPLLEALIEVADAGRTLYVLISRVTFSAAMQLVVDLERETPALFVGEPTGGSPNQYGDAIDVALPKSGLIARIATIHWTTAGESDTRLAREPDVLVNETASAFFAGKDSALDWVQRA